MNPSTAFGTLRTSLCVGFRRASCCGDRGRRCPVASPTVAVGAARRLPCAARLEGVPHNSLRSLRSLRSDRMRQVSPRSSLRSPPSRLALQAAPGQEARPFARHKRSTGPFVSVLTCSTPHTAPPPGTACRSGTRVAFEGAPPPLPAKGCPGGARRACEAPRSAGFMARERSEPRGLTWRILSERSERSERSELCAGPGTRAPQGSLSAAKAASVDRRAPPGQPCAATEPCTPTQSLIVRNVPQADVRKSARHF